MSKKISTLITCPLLLITRPFLLVLCILTIIAGMLTAEQKLEFYEHKPLISLGPIFGEDDVVSYRIVSLLFDKPIEADENFEAIPFLFENIPEPKELTTGEYQYEFHLRPGIMWSDGEELTAEDIVFTYNVIKNDLVPCNTVREKVKHITEMTAPTVYTLRVNFDIPSSSNIGALTFYILPKHCFSSKDDPTLIERSDAFFSEEPIGTGKYIKDTGFGLQMIELKVNNQYKLLDAIPKIEKIKMSHKSDVATIVEEMKGNYRINFMTEVPIANRNELNVMPDIEVKEYYDFSCEYIAFNLRHPLLKEKVLREAICIAIDKEKMIDNVFMGAAYATTGPIHTASKYYNREVSPIPNDVILAKKKLLENNYIDTDGDGILEKDGEKLSFRFIYRKGERTSENMASSVLKDLEAVGINIEIISLDPNEFNHRIYESRDFDMVYARVKFGTEPSIRPLFHSSYDRPGGFNIAGYHNQEVDNLLEEIDYKTDKDLRISLYKKLHQMVHDDYPYYFLWQRIKAVAVKNIDNVIVSPLNIFEHIDKWEIKEY